MALAVQPLLIESALLSAAGATVGLVALWTSPTVAPDRRVHGRVLRRCVVVVSCAAFCLSDLVLRAMAVGEWPVIVERQHTYPNAFRASSPTH